MERFSHAAAGTDEHIFAGEVRESLVVGIDVGQSPDPTVVTVVRIERRPTGKFDRTAYIPAYVDAMGERHEARFGAQVEETHYLVHYIQPLEGIAYPDQLAAIVTMLRRPRFLHRQVTVRVDVTGVGQPLFETLERELLLYPETRHIIAEGIRFVSGEQFNRSKGTLGKELLVGTLLQRLEWKLVHANEEVGLDALQAELEVFNREMNASSGHTTYGAETGKHDDRVISLGLAVLVDPYMDAPSHFKLPGSWS